MAHLVVHLKIICPHQWPSGSALKNSTREMLGSIPVRACQPNCSEFFEAFCKIRVRIHYKVPHIEHPAYSPRTLVQAVGLILNTLNKHFKIISLLKI